MRIVRSTPYLALTGLPLLILASVLATVTLLSFLPSQIYWLLIGYLPVTLLRMRSLRKLGLFYREALADVQPLGPDEVVVSPLTGLGRLYVGRDFLVLYALCSAALAFGYARGIWPGMCATVAGTVLAWWTQLVGVAAVIVIRWQRDHGTTLFETADDAHAYYAESAVS
jgi:hypothetical protein